MNFFISSELCLLLIKFLQCFVNSFISSSCCCYQHLVEIPFYGPLSDLSDIRCDKKRFLWMKFSSAFGSEKTKHISYDDPILVCIHNNKTDEMKVNLGRFRESHRGRRKNIVHHVTVLLLEVTINQTTRAIELQQKKHCLWFVVTCLWIQILCVCRRRRRIGNTLTRVKLRSVIHLSMR